MIVLDTHALLWWVNGKVDQFHDKTWMLIESESKKQQLSFSAISIWEIAMLVRDNRIILDRSINEWVNQLLDSDSIKVINSDSRILCESVYLPGEFHADPADRIIVATARHFDATLISKDQKILKYSHVKALW